jgi:glycosyltransferase 2 family protein
MKQRIHWVIGLLVLAGVVAFIAAQGEERRFETIVRHAAPAWLLAAIALQAGTYVATAMTWRQVLVWAGEAHPLRSLVPLGLAKLFTDQAVPSGGISGSMLVVSALQREGTSARAAITAVLVSLLGYYAAYTMALAITLAILWALGDLHWAVVVLAALLLLLAIGVMLAIRCLALHGSRQLPRWVTALPIAGGFLERIGEARAEAFSDRRLLARVTGLQLGVFALDAATLWMMLRAVGWHADPVLVFAPFVIASVAGTIGIVPGGLGTFEATSVTMLHAVGVPVTVALTATLLLRGFTFWLPMLPGVWLARRALKMDSSSTAHSSGSPRRG